MQKKILIRFADMMLKGKNIGYFIKRVRLHLFESLKDLDTTYGLEHDRLFIGYASKDEKEILDRLSRIPGLHDYVIADVCSTELEEVIETAIRRLDQDIDQDGHSIKIETKRTDKTFPMKSLDITQKVAGAILKSAKRTFVVDVRNPEITLNIDIRRDGAYIYLNSMKGMRGFPYGTAGKGLLMLSGGIDSPVAGYLAIKQGIEVELIHFESTPLTPLESVQKVIDLAKVLATYTPYGHITLHLIPFTSLHEAMLDHVFEPYMITVMRRMMYRIAEEIIRKRRMLCLINGESIGQVASQTLNSMGVVEAVTKVPIIRPLVTYDKQTIVDLSKTLGTYDISIRPYNDCCSIYVPKNPATKPMEVYAKKYEQSFDYESLIHVAIKDTVSLQIDKDKVYDLNAHGLTCLEAIQPYLFEETHDHIENQ